ncbi:ECF transporter S component [Acidaminobacter sp. JC074]|uniref:ECF transporter S component n=1 Tax=Acidaminobacter sp. JC074 TaxID=2530199 RepID=UPI001F0DB2EE|nr:ECF transporter S component [Acidaminobacter sp. JC074]MCH4889905.1 ECF transporter S component [Acidaminobacter sp. JC074]
MKRNSQINYLIKVALLSAVAGVLMLIEAPLAIFPEFLKLDISDLPAVIGAIVMGPLAGALVELVKVLLNFILNGTMTGGIGELANLLIGISLVVPVGLVYKKMPSVKGAVIGGLIGTVFMTFMGAMLNYFVLLPLYANLFGMEVIGFVEMAANLPIFGQFMETVWDFILFSIVPFNLLKGILVTVITGAIYKFVIPPLMRIQN